MSQPAAQLVASSRWTEGYGHAVVEADVRKVLVLVHVVQGAEAAAGAQQRPGHEGVEAQASSAWAWRAALALP